jgi:hypothetical protein
MKNNIKKLQLAASIILFLFLCFIFIFLYKEINTNNKDSELGTATWQTEADRREGIMTLNRSLQDDSSDRASLDTHFVGSTDVVPFLDTIGNLAASAGVAEEINSVDTGTNNDNLTVEMQVSGSFAALYKFLTLLENSPYELDFPSMSMNQIVTPGKTGKNETWQATFQIQLLTFTP